MVYIFVATLFEAKPLIDKYKLREIIRKPFSTYGNEEGTIGLIIGGIGVLNISASIGYMLSSFDKERDYLINIGYAGSISGEIGQFFVINQVLSEISDKPLFPDVINSKYSEKALFTSLEAVTIEKMEEGFCYDMEGYAFLHNAFKIMSPNRVSLIKVISDNGAMDFYSNYKNRKDILNKSMLEASSYIDFILDKAKEENVGDSSSNLLEKIEKCILVFKNKAYTTAYIENNLLRELFGFALVSNIDIIELIEQFENEGLFEEKSKRNTMKVIYELRERIIPTNL